MKILVVDDEERIRRGIKRMLETRQHDVITASNGHDAIAQLERTPCDLVITDIYMPDMDGIELIIALRRQEKTVPVIGMSGGIGHDLQAAAKLGARTVLTKPFAQEKLLRAVDAVLANIASDLRGAGADA